MCKKTGWLDDFKFMYNTLWGLSNKVHGNGINLTTNIQEYKGISEIIRQATKLT